MEAVRLCHGCGVPLTHGHQRVIGTCVDCVQASQIREREPARGVDQPGYGFLTEDDDG